MNSTTSRINSKIAEAIYWFDKLVAIEVREIVDGGKGGNYKGMLGRIEDALISGPTTLDMLIAMRSAETWRSDPASEKQIALLNSKAIAVPEGCTKGRASDLIDSALNC